MMQIFSNTSIPEMHLTNSARASVLATPAFTKTLCSVTDQDCYLGSKPLKLRRSSVASGTAWPIVYRFTKLSVHGRCRMHGGPSTGPRTPEGKERSRKASWKHGRYSREAIKRRREARDTIRVIRELIGGG
jgi:hypothetical protein